MKISELAERIGAEVRGDGADCDVVGCARLDQAGPREIAFLANPKYARQLESTDAAAVIVGPSVEDNGRTLLVAEDPYYAFRNAAVALHGFRRHPRPAGGGISEQASVDPSARIGEGTVVHPFAVVAADAEIGRDCVLYPHTYVGPGTRIGDECTLYPGVAIYEHCRLGDRVTLHANCVIGQDGFGYATHQGRHHKIPQMGNVVIEDDVEMGAGCAVDRATLGATVVGTGTKCSDLVAIGHGTKVGRHNLLVAQVGIAGSAETGDHVALGGQVGVAGHLRIGDRSRVAATSGVMDDVPDDSLVGGIPAVPLTEAKRLHLYSRRLPELTDRIKKLERQLAQLKAEVGEERDEQSKA